MSGDAPSDLSELAKYGRQAVCNAGAMQPDSMALKAPTMQMDHALSTGSAGVQAVNLQYAGSGAGARDSWAGA